MVSSTWITARKMHLYPSLHRKEPQEAPSQCGRWGDLGVWYCWKRRREGGRCPNGAPGKAVHEQQTLTITDAMQVVGVFHAMTSKLPEQLRVGKKEWKVERVLPNAWPKLTSSVAREGSSSLHVRPYGHGAQYAYPHATTWRGRPWRGQRKLPSPFWDHRTFHYPHRCPDNPKKSRGKKRPKLSIQHLRELSSFQGWGRTELSSHLLCKYVDRHPV